MFQDETEEGSESETETETEEGTGSETEGYTDEEGLEEERQSGDGQVRCFISSELSAVKQKV